MLKFYIVLKNSSECELDRSDITVKNEDGITAAALGVIKDWVLAEGDHIVIEAVQS